MPVDTFHLTVAPPTLTFSPDRETDLQEHLTDLEKNTKTMCLKLPSQLMFNKSGLVQGDLRMTTTAMGQLCSLLAPGLSLVVKDLISDEEGADTRLAIKTLNELTHLRFKQKLADRRIVIDTVGRRIDGIVGPKYVQLPNSELYRRSKQFVCRHNKAEFHEAVVSGRRIMVQYRSADPIIELEDDSQEPDTYFGGYHFSNSEVGECAVRAAALIVRKVCSNGAVGTVKEGGRLAHVRLSNFEERFEALLDYVRKKSQEPSLLAARMGVLKKTTLDIGGSNGEHVARCKHIIRRLRKAGLPKKFASRVMSRTILCSANDVGPMHSYLGVRPKMTDVRGRNLYDLFNAITFEAKKLPVSLRESAEQLAYLILVGRFGIH